MSEEKKEQKIDLKDRMLSDDDLNQVAGGSGDSRWTCPSCGAKNDANHYFCSNCGW